MNQIQKFGFFGLGLIGGSLAKALKRSMPECSIAVFTRTREKAEQARRDGIADTVCSSLSDPAFSQCDIIFLCAPVDANIEALQILKDLVPSSCILTDVGSVKTDIHLAAAQMGLGGRFIGGHPMTGSEKSGYQYAVPHLFENSYYIITPSEGTSQKQLEAYQELVRMIGALPLLLDYRKHDFATAAVSHLPHLIAASLVNTVHTLDGTDQLMKMIAAGGFKDITRIASSSPEMWEQICLENRENISKVMDTFISLLEESRTAMQTDNGEEINAMFRESRDYRNTFTSSPYGFINKTYRIFCDILDESGAIATIATILAVNRINIKNIGIIHSREFEEGVLQIDFYEEEPFRKAVQVLEHHRYQVWIR